MRTCPQCNEATLGALSIALCGPARPVKCSACGALVSHSLGKALKAVRPSLYAAAVASVAFLFSAMFAPRFVEAAFLFMMLAMLVAVSWAAWLLAFSAPLAVVPAATVRRSRIIAAVIFAIAALMFFAGPPSGWRVGSNQLMQPTDTPPVVGSITSRSVLCGVTAADRWRYMPQ